MSSRVDFNSYAFLRYIRYLHAATVISKRSMVLVMCTYTENKTTKTYKEDMLQYYDSNPNKKTPEGRYKNDFTQSERILLEDETVTPERFDITLNDKVIRRMHLLTGFAFDYEKIWTEDEPPGSNSSIEHLIFKVKSHRNRVCHETLNLTEQELQDILNDLHNLNSTLVEKVLKAKNKPLHYISKKLKEIKQDFESLKKPICEELTEEAIEMYSKENKDFLRMLRKKIKESCQYYLIKLYEELYDRNPAEWLAFTQPLDAEEIFTEMKIKEEEKNIPNNSNIHERVCDYKEILTAQTQKKKTPRILTLTGVGGNGKSTYTRVFVCKWGRKKGCFEGLQDVDILLFMELRDHSDMSFDEMLRYRLGEVLSDVGVTFQKLKEIILDLKVLIILDGQDEAIQNNLLNDVLRLVTTNINVRLMVTTRPNASIALKDVVSKHQVPQLELMLMGIAKQHQLTFIKKYVVAMQTDLDKQSKIIGTVSEELPHLNDSLGEIMQSPLILALLSILWVEGEILASATTTEIFMKVSKLLRGKLVSRILQKMTSINKETLKVLLCKFEAYLAETAFSAFYYQETTLKEETLALLKNKLQACQLAAYEAEIFGHYLLPKKSIKNMELVIQYCFKHLRLQEHEASNFVCHILSRDNKDFTNEMNQQFIIHQLQEERFCNIRTHTLYMIAVNHPQLFIKFGKSLVNFQDRHSSSDNVDKYLNAVLESKTNQAVIEMVSLNLSKMDRWEVANSSSLASLLEVMKINYPKELSLKFSSLAQLPTSFNSYLQTIATYNIKLELPLSVDDYLQVVLESKGNKAVVNMVASNMAKLNDWNVTKTSHLASLMEVIKIEQPKKLSIHFDDQEELPTCFPNYLETIVTYDLELELNLSVDGYLKVVLESKGNKAVLDMVASNMTKLNKWKVTNPSYIESLMEVMKITHPNELHLKFNDQVQLPTSFTSNLQTIITYDLQLVLDLSIANYLKVVIDSQGNKAVVDLITKSMAKLRLSVDKYLQLFIENYGNKAVLDMMASSMAKLNEWNVTKPSNIESLMEVMKITHPSKLCLKFKDQEQLPTSFTSNLQTIMSYNLQLVLDLSIANYLKVVIESQGNKAVVDVVATSMAKLRLSVDKYLQLFLESDGNKAVLDMVASNMAKLKEWKITNPSSFASLMEVMKITHPNKLLLKFNDQEQLPTSFTSNLQAIMSYNLELVLDLSAKNYLEIVIENQENKAVVDIVATSMAKTSPSVDKYLQLFLESDENKAVIDMLASNMAKLKEWKITNPSSLASLMEVMQKDHPEKLTIEFDDQEQLPTSFTDYLQTIVTYDLELDLRLPFASKYNRAVAADNEHLLATVQPHAQAKVVTFWGHLSSEAIQQLPPSLTSLCVVLLADDLKALFLKIPDLVKLTYLSVVVQPSKLTCVSDLPKLQPRPGLEDVDLEFRGEDVSDWHHMAVLLQRINIGRDIGLFLTESNITGAGAVNLLNNIIKQRVTCYYISITSTQLPNEEEQRELRTQVRRCCSFGSSWYCGEKNINLGR